MAKILSKNDSKLVITLFGQKIEITKAGGSLPATGSSETVPRIQTVFGQVQTWFQASSHGSISEFGPIFGENLEFWVAGQSTACFATHDGNLGVRDVPDQVKEVVDTTLGWLAG